MRLPFRFCTGESLMHFCRVRRLTLGALGALSATGPIVGAAQESSPVAQTNALASHAALDHAVMDRTIALHLDRVTLRQALATLSATAGLRLVYSRQELPVEKTVSLVADNITVGEALHVLLRDTGVEPEVSESGQVWLRPTGAATPVGGVQLQGTATISGYVRDSATGASIPQVMIRIDGTTLEAKSDGEGHYAVTGIAAGEYRVTARRVGYVAKTRTITVNDGQSAALNFQLNPPATKLDEVVTTAVGEQRRYQVGNVISSINVDSIAPTAPVTSVMDIISGRAPGVEVISSSGMAGAGSSIRIWGQGSLLLQSDPIIIVDGMRVDNSEGQTALGGVGVTPTPSRINDLDFSQIQTIDILKGPSATTEYGSDAANGVIVITTKHGASGAPQWHASADQSEGVVPNNFANYYWSWGHLTDGTATTSGIDCTLLAPYGGNFGSGSAIGGTSGTCIVDSITAYNPLNHTATTSLGPSPSQRYDIDVGGGSDVLRYFVAADLTNDIGGTHIPNVFLGEAAALGLPQTVLDPNSENQRSVRVNTTFGMGHGMDMQTSIAYMSTYQKAPGGGEFTGDIGVAGPALPDSIYDYGYGVFGCTYTACPGLILQSLGNISNQNETRWTGGLTANWRPGTWLAGHATFGLDHGAQSNTGEVLPQLCYPFLSYSCGRLTDEEQTTEVYTVDMRGTATASFSPLLHAVTSLGVQLADDRTAGTSATAFNLSASEFPLNASTNENAQELLSRSATLGGYVEEQLQLADRVFVTGALRLDEGSNFGNNYGAAYYPKLSVSWLAVDRGPTTVRLRAALGPSGQQPPYGANQETFAYSTTVPGEAGGSAATGLALNGPGNPELAPERIFRASVKAPRGSSSTVDIRPRVDIMVTTKRPMPC